MIWIRLYHKTVIRIRILKQYLVSSYQLIFSSVSDPDPGPIRIQGLMTKDGTKYTAEKFFIYFFDKKIAIYLSPGLRKKRTSKPQEKPSALKREHPALQNMKFHHFYLFLWVIYALLDPDPPDLIESVSNSDPGPDPKH